MKDELFEELSQSIREGGAILRGEKEPSRIFHLEEPNVSAIREKYGLSQTKFAAMLGISVKTLRNWEQVVVSHKVQRGCYFKLSLDIQKRFST